MKRALTILMIVSVLGAMIAAAALVAWRVRLNDRSFYTDAESIEVPVESADVRDVLWRPAELLQGPVNSPADDLDPRISADGMTMYLVRASDEGDSDILVSTRSADGWSEPQPFPPLNSSFDDLGPTPALDGRAIYFYSNRPGGHGGFDLWRIDRTETGWSDAVNLGAAVNSRWNDYGPAVSSDGSLLYFASDRPETGREGPASDGVELPEGLRAKIDYDLYLAMRGTDGTFGTAAAVAALNTGADEITPALSPSGDFLYFASDRAGGLGGFDLYRSRRVHGEHREPEHFGTEINSSMNEIAPALDMAGFALQFNSDRPLRAGPSERAGVSTSPASTGEGDAPSDHNIYRALSREVFTARADARIDWWGIWNAIWPSLLWLLLGLLLLLALLRYLQKSQFNRLSLLARCLLVSLLVHLMVMMLLTAWSVTTTLSEMMQADGATRVALVSHAASQSLEGQIRGTITDVEVAAPAPTATEQRESSFEAPPPPPLTTVTTEVAEQSREVIEHSTVEAELADVSPREPAARMERPRPPEQAAMTEAVNLALPAPNQPQPVEEADLSVADASTNLPSRPAQEHFSTHSAPSAISADLPPQPTNRSNDVAQSSLAAPSELRERAAPSELIRAAASDVRVPDIATAVETPALPEAAPPAPQSEPGLRIAGAEAVSSSPGPRAVADLATAGPQPSTVDFSPASTTDDQADQPLVTNAPTLRESQAGETVLATPPPPSDVVLRPTLAAADLSLPREVAAASPQPEEQLAVTPGSASGPASRAQVGTDLQLQVTEVSTAALDIPPGQGATAPADSGSLANSTAIIDFTAGEMPSRASPSQLASADGLPSIDVALPAMQERHATSQSESPTDPSGTRLPVADVAGAAPGRTLDSESPPVLSVPRADTVSNLAPTATTRDASSERALFDQSAAPTLESATADIALFAPAQVGSEVAHMPSPPLTAAPLRMPTDLPPPADHSLAQRTYEQRAEIIEDMGGSAETERAVADALRWLADHQSDDGHWDGNDFDISGECGGETTAEVDLALTGLALMAFLASDNTHDKPGPFRDNVRRGLDWLVGQQQHDGSLMGEETLYSHGIATIAICEALAMTDDPGLEDHARRATQFILDSPSRESGGWRYAPGQFGDTSVTGWQVLALASARRAGLQLPPDALGHVRDWMERVRDPAQPGRYGYQPQAQFSPAMTAEGMFIRQILGVPRDDPDMRASVDFMLRNLPEWTREREQNSYYWYYATLAMFHYQGDEWDQWNEELKEVLLANQRQDGCAAGSWDPIDQWSKIGGRVYQTAICALCLQIYYRFQPIYTSNEVIAPIGTIRGEVRDKLTQEFLPGATIRLDLPDREPIIATTDYSGRYSLAAPEMPEFFAITATMPGYSPQSSGAAAEELAGKVLVRNFLLDPLSEQLISIEDDPEVHHVGNDRFEGAINSQFQRRSEGEIWSAVFELNETQATGFRDAELILLCKGVQAANIITINGRRLSQRLSSSPSDGSYGEFVTPIEVRLLREGENEITIQSSDSLGDLDDFEFVNVRIRLINPR